MRFKNDQFKIWLEGNKHMSLAEFANMPQPERVPVLQEFMDADIETSVVIMSEGKITTMASRKEKPEKAYVRENGENHENILRNFGRG